MIFIRKALEKITSHWVILLIEQIMIAVSLTTVILFFNILTRHQSSQTDLLVYFTANLVISLFGTWFFQTHAGIIRYTEINDITTVLKYVSFHLLLGAHFPWVLENSCLITNFPCFYFLHMQFSVPFF